MSEAAPSLYQMVCYKLDYATWYEKANGGRQPLTVAGLRDVLKGMPSEMDDVRVKVSHQYDRHPIGIHDPMYSTRDIATIVSFSKQGTPIMGMTSPKLQYLIFE